MASAAYPPNFLAAHGEMLSGFMGFARNPTPRRYPGIGQPRSLGVEYGNVAASLRLPLGRTGAHTPRRIMDQLLLPIHAPSSIAIGMASAIRCR